MFKIIYINTRSLTIELNNNSCYYSPNDYNFYVNDKLIYKNYNKNILSLFDLEPDTTYSLKYEDLKTNQIYIEKVTTKKEFVSLNVKKFGAKGDGISNDTNFIQAAILACPNDSRVYIPKGTYLVGPLFLKSNITIEIAKDAILLGDTNRYNYPILPGIIESTDEKDEYNLGTWEGNPLDMFATIITGINVENVNIIGQGIINGNANNSDWWNNHHTKILAWRPRGIFLNNCKNINIQGITVTNTPAWNLHPYFSENIRFLDLNIISPADSPNTDGCDPESCNNIDIIGINFSVGDDCIAIKAGKIYMGRKYKRPSENFNIRNCFMNKGHGAVVLGSEMSGGIRNIKVSQCLFNETDRGLRIKTRRGRGKNAIIDGILFENIIMDKVLVPIAINMFYFCDPDGKTEYVYTREKLPVDDRTPYLGKFHFKDLIINNVESCCVSIHGLPEQKVKEVILENIDFTIDKEGQDFAPVMMTGQDKVKKRAFIFENIEKVIFKNVKVVGYENQLIEQLNVDKIEELS